MADQRKQYISDSIRTIPDFPKKAFRFSLEDLVERYKDKDIDIVAGFEARGFIFGAPLALQLGVGFVPLRKPGKLPGETIQAEYTLEYGSDKLEMHVGHVKEGQRVLLVDDLVATGGTMAAGIQLVKQVGGVIVECAAIIELPDLDGRAKLGDTPLYVQVQKEESVPAEEEAYRDPALRATIQGA